MADFSVKDKLFYTEMVPYWTHVKQVKHVLYINETYRKKTSFHKLNNIKEYLLIAKMSLERFGF